MLQLFIDWRHRISGKQYPLPPPPTHHAPNNNVVNTTSSPEPVPAKPTDIVRSSSWESWASSESSLCDWQSNKEKWSFKEDYVSFPQLDAEDDNNTGTTTEKAWKYFTTTTWHLQQQRQPHFLYIDHVHYNHFLTYTKHNPALQHIYSLLVLVALSISLSVCLSVYIGPYF